MIQAHAEDAAGNIDDAYFELLVVDPTDTTPPSVALTSPSDTDVIEWLTNIEGTVTDGGTLIEWEVTLEPTGGGEPLEAAAAPPRS